MYDVHKLTGVVSFALLIVIAMTGAYWGFTPQYEDALAWLTQGPARRTAPKVDTVPGASSANLDVVLSAALRNIPEGEARLFTFASRPDLPHSLSASDFSATSSAFISGHSGDTRAACCG